MRIAQKKRNGLIILFNAIVTLSLMLFAVPLLFADPGVVYKKARPQQDLTKEEKYFYRPLGKVDPFAPFIIKEEERPEDFGLDDLTRKKSKRLAAMDRLLKKLREPKTELQRIGISKLTLTAIIKGKSKTWAMVSDQKGRGYKLEKGTYIGKNGGIVDKIISEEKYTAFGRQSVRKITIKEPYVNREQNLDYRFIEMEMPYNMSVYK
ncbi:MAG: pilus assembly protein PilP [Deltaproteobacteria bacterium]|nr:pilus assembly protein PilP [Deltaproteobacteria bacterium]MBW1736258.1 pilus assembly protein PilP [Deltaproteobacteria bacterium]MBW1908327.1 pilus assembly protein PilP [Deltaproteobacteria bacterium]MBW2032592.1 pilus assembly protein PilP [Deltaproteobacteria bacterium]MBW2113563.1 pilus assembly protein PilP [Deltaproteobacteria bacterium]